QCHTRSQLLQARHGRLEGRDDLVLATEYGRPVEPDIVRHRAVLCGAPRQTVNPSGLDQGLLWDSAAVDAGTTERSDIDERNARVGLGGGLERVDARRPASDHEQIVTIHPI